MASYIGIPVPEELSHEFFAFQQKILADEYENFPHLTLDYLWSEKIHFASKILEQVQEKCADILDKKVIFDKIISFENKNNQNETIIAFGANVISLKILKRVYDAMRIDDWHSKSPSKNWIPHITIAKVSTKDFDFWNNFPKNPPKIILPLSEIQIL